MRLTVGTLPRMFDGLDNAERVALHIRLAASDDYAGVQALLRSLPRHEYRCVDADFVERMRLLDRMTDRLVLAACALASTRQAYRIAGKRHELHHDRYCEQMHGADAMADLADANAAFTAEHGHAAWWDEMGLKLGDMVTVMHYEDATIQLVQLWEAYDAWCEREMHVDGRTAIQGSLTALNGRSIMHEIDAAIAERECAEHPRWIDAMQQHQPLWVHDPEVLTDAQRTARQMFSEPFA